MSSDDCVLELWAGPSPERFVALSAFVERGRGVLRVWGNWPDAPVGLRPGVPAEVVLETFREALVASGHRIVYRGRPWVAARTWLEGSDVAEDLLVGSGWVLDPVRPAFSRHASPEPELELELPALPLIVDAEEDPP